MKDGFEIIDAHCHIYPDKIAQAASDHTGEFYSMPMEYNGTVKALLEEGEAGGVDRYIVQSVAVTAKQVPSINTYIANEVKSSGGKFAVGLGTLHLHLARRHRGHDKELLWPEGSQTCRDHVFRGHGPQCARGLRTAHPLCQHHRRGVDHRRGCELHHGRRVLQP